MVNNKDINLATACNIYILNLLTHPKNSNLSFIKYSDSNVLDKLSLRHKLKEKFKEPVCS